MLAFITTLSSLLLCRLRSRAALELEVVALRHQLAVLRRQRPGRPRLTSMDRLLWVWLYRVWPRCLKVMVLVKSATVVQWHRQGFRLYWHWRSRPGRPRAQRELRDLIRQMSSANPLWGAPRIHGELLKLGIEVSQATVAKYMVRRVGRPSPTWRSFLRNQAAGIAAIDMFVVVSASFRLLYVMIILAHDRRRIIRFDVTEHPTAIWLSQQVTEAFPWDTVRVICCETVTLHMAHISATGLRRWGSPRFSRHTITVAESICRARDWLDAAGMSGSHRDFQRAPFAPRAFILRGLLPPHSDTSFARQGLSALASDPVAAQPAKSSPSRKSVVCTTVTSASQRDSSH